MSAQFFSEATLRDPVNRRKANRARILFVEGPDDLWFFDHLLTRKNAKPEEVQLIDYGGLSHFENNLSALLKEDIFQDDDVRAFAIIQDADRKIAKRTADLEGKYARMIGAPELKIGQMNKVRLKKQLHVGAYILPNNTLEGNLESLLLSTIESRASVQAAEAYMSRFDESGAEDQDKRIAQVYLATKKELRRGSGQASRDGYFDLDSSKVDDLNVFIDSFLQA